MSWLDRLIGIAFGAFLGVVVVLIITGVSTFFSPTSQSLLIGLANGMFFGLCLWGWYGGAYALGRVVAWTRRHGK